MKTALRICLVFAALTGLVAGCSSQTSAEDEIVSGSKADDLFSEHVFDADTASCNSAFFCGRTLGRAFPNAEGELTYCSCQSDCQELGDCCADFGDSCEANLALACAEDAECEAGEACVDGACELPACESLDAEACDERLTSRGDCDLGGFVPAEDEVDEGSGCESIEPKACNRIFAESVCGKRIDCTWDGEGCE